MQECPCLHDADGKRPAKAMYGLLLMHNQTRSRDMQTNNDLERMLIHIGQLHGFLDGSVFLTVWRFLALRQPDDAQEWPSLFRHWEATISVAKEVSTSEALESVATCRRC